MCKECPICFEPLFVNTDPKIMRLKRKVLVKRGEKLPITKLKCGHTFHNKCIKNWFMKTEVESSTKCPMCRENIRFKPDSKNFMMHKMRYDDPDYEYGDENLYEIETDSDYDIQSNDGDEIYTFRFPIYNNETDDDTSSDYDDDCYEDDIETIQRQMSELETLAQQWWTEGERVEHGGGNRVLVDYSDVYE